jgi:shikimate kinase
VIALIGPGGAGKTTVGARVADQLSLPFADLDGCFNARCGDISAFIESHGYPAYARENVQTLSLLLDERGDSAVVALSSGFMTYPRDVHPHYALRRRCVAESRTTFVLLPSLDYEACVTETVRRQLRRPFARPAAREEAVIRERFPIYSGLRARKIETMRPIADVVAEIVAAILSPPWTHSHEPAAS